MWVIQHQGANHFNPVGNYPFGCFSYYADIRDAVERHEYVRSMSVWVDEPRHDCLGKPFKLAPKWRGQDWE